MPITTLDSLQLHLQWAIEIEHATIPPYLCTLYSIPDGENTAAAAVIRSVVMEEMLHMTLAANLLNAVGGTVNLLHPGFVPDYPVCLPHSDGAFEVSLQKFSPEAIETFLKIEHPAAMCAPPQDNHYQTIAQFYEAIGQGFSYLIDAHGEGYVFKDVRNQVTPEFYYGGGGEVFPVTDGDSAFEALEVIVEQGEGLNQGIYDGDDENFGQEAEVAHYYRFNEILLGRFYQRGDTPSSGPSGPLLPRSWSAAYNMLPNPKAQKYAEGTEIRAELDRFNRLYTELLALLNGAYNGNPNLMLAAVPFMYKLKYSAVNLMRTPSPVPGFTVGPSFQGAPYGAKAVSTNPLFRPRPESAPDTAVVCAALAGESAAMTATA
jgi:hypothetical protein